MNDAAIHPRDVARCRASGCDLKFSTRGDNFKTGHTRSSATSWQSLPRARARSTATCHSTQYPSATTVVEAWKSRPATTRRADWGCLVWSQAERRAAKLLILPSFFLSLFSFWTAGVPRCPVVIRPYLRSTDKTSSNPALTRRFQHQTPLTPLPHPLSQIRKKRPEGVWERPRFPSRWSSREGLSKTQISLTAIYCNRTWPFRTHTR